MSLKHSHVLFNIFYFAVVIFLHLHSFFFWFYVKVLSVPLLSSYPLIAMLSGLGLSLLVNCASLFKNVLCVSVFFR